ncbi:MAG: hypothetical protein K2M82_05570 [Lachnospiraceae bacterium]|nr:hypothetical protein [Lachnospiraceae bacterium]
MDLSVVIIAVILAVFIGFAVGFFFVGKKHGFDECSGCPYRQACREGGLMDECREENTDL